AAGLAPPEREVDRTDLLDRVAGQDGIAEAPRRCVERRADRDLPAGREVDVGRKVMPARTAQRHLLERDDPGLEFEQHASDTLGIVATVGPDALVHVPGRYAQHPRSEAGGRGVRLLPWRRWRARRGAARPSRARSSRPRSPP